MRTRPLHIAALLVLLLSTACEQTVDIDDLQPEAEKLVVMGGIIVTGDSVRTGFWFQRTAPLQVRYDPDQYLVSDVDFTLRSAAGDIPLQPAGTDNWIDWRLSGFGFSHILASSLRAGPTQGQCDFDMTFHWKDRSIPVTLTAPDLPLQLTDVHLWKADSGGLWYVSFVYPVQSNGEEVTIDFQFFDDTGTEERSWRTSYTRWWDLVVQFPTHYADRDTMQLHGLEGYELTRLRYRVVLEDRYAELARYAASTSDADPEEVEYSLLDPDGTNPLFNVTGDGIGFVWYKRFGEWTEIP